jgi:predicted secreted Zn-dependent protease
MNKFLCILLSSILFAVPASAATVKRTFSYFSVHGKTLDQIQAQLDAHGPVVGEAGDRHPGATRMEFSTRLTYGRGKSSCRIVKADVTVKAKVFLPRWRDRRRAEPDVRVIWDTIARDIKRHEESHLSIAKNHARDLEAALRGLYPMSNCDALAAKARKVSARLLAEHDAEQARFDRIENKNFEWRILSLLRYRLEQMAEQTPGH